MNPVLNIIAQLIHQPDTATATHLKNLCGWPRDYTATDKAHLVKLLQTAIDTHKDPTPL